MATGLHNGYINLSNLKFLLLDEFDDLLKNSEEEIMSLIERVLRSSTASIILVSATLGD